MASRKSRKDTLKIDWPNFEKLHLRLPIPGRINHIYFAYIRKNASTSLTRYLVDQTDFASLFPDEDQDIRFRQLALSHGTTEENELRRHDSSAVILREPVRRAYSTFCNKVVAEAGANDFWSTVDGRIGPNARSLTTEEFFRGYFSPTAQGKVDAHLIPQSRHMWSRSYDYVIRLDELYFWATTTLGAAAAERFFLVRLNATERPGSDPHPRITIRELQARFQMGRGIPSLEWFSARVGDQIASIYFEDLRIWQTSRFWGSK